MSLSTTIFIFLSTWLLIIIGKSPTHMHNVYICLLSDPYIHNTMIYRCNVNLQNTFKYWLQFRIFATVLYPNIQQILHNKSTQQTGN